VIIRLIEKRDYDGFRRLFDEAYSEYLQWLKHTSPQQYEKERREKDEVTLSGFGFYAKTGSSFAAEEDGKLVGYVASQTVPSMHGVDLWVEYIVVQQSFRRRGIGTALLRRLVEYAKNSGMDRIYAFINPDNEASMKLHSKAGFNVDDWKIASYKAQA
jgi:L-amino acid N-acyltransferase YncA